MTPYYADDSVTLYHGDCREVTVWLEADVLVTDPPYGIGWGDAPMTSYTGGQGFAGTITGDATPDVRDAILAMWGSRPALVFGSWRVARPHDVRSAIFHAGIATGPGHVCPSSWRDIGWIP